MTPAKDRTILFLAAGFLFVGLIGLLTPEWFTNIVQSSLAKGLVVLGVMMQMRASLVSFGQGLFYCLGGYAAGMAGSFLGMTDVFVLLLLGTVVAVSIAAVLGFLMSRYREIFFAMLSLAFSMVLYGLLVKAEALGSTDGFNVPNPTFLGFAPTKDVLRLMIFILTCVVAFAICAGVHRYLHATFGYVGDAIRQNEVRVEYLGVSVRGAIHLKYVIAAGISGIGGVLTAIAVGHVDPNLAYWTTSGEFVFVVILSGTGSVAAPFIGSFLLELVKSYAYDYSPETWQLVLGATMLAVILFLPGGLWSLTRRGER